MRVALLYTKPTSRGDYLLEAFLRGLQVHGDSAFKVTARDSLTLLDAADVAVQVTYPNRHHDGNPVAKFRVDANAYLNSNNKRVITIDTGFVHNQPDAELRHGFDVNDTKKYSEFDDKIYYSVGYDGLKYAADYCPGKIRKDRWERLNCPLRPWRTIRKGHVLLVGQPLHGLSSQDVDIYDWYRSVAETMARKSEPDRLSLVFRQHPRITTIRTNDRRRAEDEAKITKAIGEFVDFSYSKNKFLEDDLANAWACVTYTSNAAVTAIIHGVTTYVGNVKYNMATPVSPTIHAFPHMLDGDRTLWAYLLAYSQWNVTDMRSGACWQHLRPYVHHKRK